MAATFCRSKADRAARVSASKIAWEQISLSDIFSLHAKHHATCPRCLRERACKIGDGLASSSTGMEVREVLTRAGLLAD